MNKTLASQPTLITVPEAAQHLRISRSAVYAAIAAGRLTRYEQYGRVLVAAEEVASYRPIAGAGRPRGRRQGRPRRANNPSA